MKLFSLATLSHLLIGKSIAEAVLVAAIAIGFYGSTTNSNLQGSLDQADATSIIGWAVDEKNPGRRVDVQLFIDDRFIEQRVATAFKPGVRQSGRVVDDWHGFVFATPQLATGEHEARVYVVHDGNTPKRRTLQMIGKPIRFRISAAPTK